MDRKSTISHKRRALALLLAVLMVLTIMPTAFGTGYEAAEEVSATYESIVPASTRGSNYRNLSLTPGATTTEMRFTWHSGSPTGSIRITHATEPARTIATTPNVPVQAREEAMNLTAAAGAPSGMGGTGHIPTRAGYSYFLHQAAAYDLTPGETYTYVIVWDNGESAPKTFSTGGESGSFSFLIAGDPQLGVGDGLQGTTNTVAAARDGAAWRSALDIAADHTPGAAFILSVGDQIHTMGTTTGGIVSTVGTSQFRYDQLFSSEVLQSIPLMPVVGNHDGAGGNNANARLWPLHYNIPASSTVNTAGNPATANVFRYAHGMYTQFDYWVRWDNVFFMVLDSNSFANNSFNGPPAVPMAGARLAFMDAAFAANDDADWKIVTFHHPPYSVYRTTTAAPKSAIINDWIPHFQRLGVDAVLSGHCHVYNRTHQMISNAPQLNQQWLNANAQVVAGTTPTNAVLDPTGIVYFAFNSASGSGFYNAQNMGARPYIANWNQNFRRNFSVADVTPDSFSIRTYQINDDDSHTLIDVYTIVQSATGTPGVVPPSVTSTLQLDSVQPTGTRPMTAPQTFVGFTNPPARNNVAHGAPATAAGLGLPANVGIETNLFNLTGDLPSIRDSLQIHRPFGTFAVTWDVAGSAYDPNVTAEQTFTVTGTVAGLPAGVANPLGLPLTVTIEVTVLGGTPSERETIAAWASNLMETERGYERYNVGTTSGGAFTAGRYDETARTVSSVPGTAGIHFVHGNDGILPLNVGTGGGINATNAAGQGSPTAAGLDGMADNAWWVTTVSTEDYVDIEVEWGMRSSNTAPRYWQLQFSTDSGATWVNAGAVHAVTNNGGTIGDEIVTRQLPEEAEGVANLQIRWLMAANTAVNGGSTANGGTHAIGNIRISGEQAEELPTADVTIAAWANAWLNAERDYPAVAFTAPRWDADARTLRADPGTAVLGFNDHTVTPVARPLNPGSGVGINVQGGLGGPEGSPLPVSMQAYYWTVVSTEGFENIYVDADIRTVASSPRDWQLQFRVGATGTWTDAGDLWVTTNTGSFANRLNDRPPVRLPAAAEDVAELHIRWVVASGFATGDGGTRLINTAGSPAIGNIRISGDTIVPGGSIVEWVLTDVPTFILVPNTAAGHAPGSAVAPTGGVQAATAANLEFFGVGPLAAPTATNTGVRPLGWENDALSVRNYTDGDFGGASGAQRQNGLWWRTAISSTGLEGIEVAWSQRASNNGSRGWTLQYSTNGTTWATVPGGVVDLTPTATAGINDPVSQFSAMLPASAENAATLYLRWIMTDVARPDSAGNAQAGGRQQINNIVITAGGGGEPDPVVDRTALNAEIALSQPVFDAGQVAGPWTDETWNPFVTAFNAAIAARDNTEATQQQVTTAANNLATARVGLDDGTEPETLTVTLQAVTDFHGHMNSWGAVADPGFGRFITFMDQQSALIEQQTGFLPVVLHAGDTFFGQAAQNIFWGEPALWALNRVGVRYGAIGNHEFSWQNRTLTESLSQPDVAARRAMLATVNRAPNPMWTQLPVGHPLQDMVNPGIPFLAADVIYADTHPDTALHGTSPEWAQPYAILDDWYDDYGVKVALVGLTHPNIESMSGAGDRLHLHFRTPGMPGTGLENYEWLEDMITMLRDPDGPYGVNAVVAITHVSTGGYTNNIINTLRTRGNAHLDGFFSGHSHSSSGSVTTVNGRRTAQVIGAHHGRGIGQIQLDFEDGVLVDMRAAARNQVDGTNATHIRFMPPYAPAMQFVHGVGTTWTIGGTNQNATVNLTYPTGMRVTTNGFDAGPDLDALIATPVADRMDWGWEQLAEYALGFPLGTRLTWANNNTQADYYLTHLLWEMAHRTNATDKPVTPGFDEFGGTVIVGNNSSWRGGRPGSFNPDSVTNEMGFRAAMTFENIMPLFEIRGRDLIEMLNMPPGGATSPPTGETWGRWPVGHAQAGHPNWGTMQGQTLAGTFFHNGEWHSSTTLLPIDPDGIYRVGTSNHLFNNYNASGGQSWPTPGNLQGNALGFEVINFNEEGEPSAGLDFFSRGPRTVLQNSLGNVTIIQLSWTYQAAWRGQQNPNDIVSWVGVTTDGLGTAALHVWGNATGGTQRNPGASSHSGWGNPSAPATAAGVSSPNTTRDRVFNGSVVRATATAPSPLPTDYTFLGWFDGNTRVSRDLVHVFAVSEDVTLEARWGIDDGPGPLTATFFGIGDFHGFLTSELGPGDDPGAPRFVRFVDNLQEDLSRPRGTGTGDQAGTGYEAILLHAGDTFFGQSINNLFLGEPALRVLNRLNMRYGAVGNHEFNFNNRTLTESFGIADQAARAAMIADIPNPIHDILPDGHPLREVEPGIPFLAADMVYAEGQPNAGQHPNWVQPYAIIEGPTPGSTEWYDDYGVRIAIIGLQDIMQDGLVVGANREGLHFRTPGIPGTGAENYVWLEEMINMLRDPNGDYGVAAVLAITHVSTGASSNNIINTLNARGYAQFDGWFSGHSHSHGASVIEAGGNRTVMAAGGHHTRGFGQIQFDFEDGALVASRSAAVGAANGAPVRNTDPDPEVWEWVWGVGAEFVRNGMNHVIPPPNMPSLELPLAERTSWGWVQVRDYLWNTPLGIIGTYSRNQSTRNQALINMAVDFINREHGNDMSSELNEPWGNRTIISFAQSGWRAGMLNWDADDEITMNDLQEALTFDRNITLFEMRGRDVIEVLSMREGGSSGAIDNPHGGVWGRWPDPLPADAPAWAVPGEPNWRTMQSETVAGAFLHDGQWHLTATLEPIDPDGIYRLGMAHNLYMGYGELGSQRWPAPGNVQGNALGFEVIDFVDGNYAWGSPFDRGPRFSARDEAGNHINYHGVWERELAHRAAVIEDGGSVASTVTVQVTGGGTAALAIWGHSGAGTTRSYWGPPAMPGGGTTTDLILHGAAVRATATAPSPMPAGYEFLGWFDGNTRVSTDLVYIFNAPTTNTTLEARFGEPAELTIVSPYEDVDWDAFGRYRAAMHVHTTRSDGGNFADTVLHHYNMGFDILAITDHNVTHPGPWNDGGLHALTDAQAAAILAGTYEGTFPTVGGIGPALQRPATQGGMIYLPFTNEQSHPNDMNTFWADFNNQPGWTNLQVLEATREAGGLAWINHPGRYTGGAGGGAGGMAANNNPLVISRYLEWMDRFPETLVGMEIFNRWDNETRSDRVLWDNLLQARMPYNRPIWGFSADDSHGLYDIGFNWNVMLMDALTADNTRAAMEDGAFYMVTRINRGVGPTDPAINATIPGTTTALPIAGMMNPAVSGQILAQAAPPSIVSIEVDGNVITIEGADYDRIEWIADGAVIHTGATLDVAARWNVINNNYVRAQLISTTGMALTQPFGVFEDEPDVLPVVNNLESIDAPRQVNADLDTEITADALRLPPTVTLVSDKGWRVSVPVVWDLTGITSTATAAVFTVPGTFALPEGWTNTDDIALTVTVELNIAEIIITPIEDIVKLPNEPNPGVYFTVEGYVSAAYRTDMVYIQDGSDPFSGIWLVAPIGNVIEGYVGEWVRVTGYRGVQWAQPAVRVHSAGDVQVLHGDVRGRPALAEPAIADFAIIPPAMPGEWNCPWQAMLVTFDEVQLIQRNAGHFQQGTYGLVPFHILGGADGMVLHLVVDEANFPDYIEDGDWISVSRALLRWRGGSAAHIAHANMVDGVVARATPQPRFVDVPFWHWGWQFVQDAYDNGFMTGYSATHFNPYGRLTRAQAAQIILNKA
ncbi:MAG: metallophosphoesterase, partial [Oscillospiraceae bacterium]|nr:metallophosphoesterase [Oscillospiraceae bacterium]